MVTKLGRSALRFMDFRNTSVVAQVQNIFPGRFPGNVSLSYLLRAELLKGKNVDVRNSELSPSRLKAMLQLNRGLPITSHDVELAKTVNQ